MSGRRVVSFIICWGLIVPGMASAKTVTLVWATAREATKLNTEIARLFEKRNPNIRIRIENYIWDWPSKILTSVAGGKAPDIAQGFTAEWRAMIDRNLFLAIDPYLKTERFQISQFSPQLLRCWKKDGKLYSLPVYSWTMAGVYNETYFNQRGLANPKDDWTWGDALQMAKKMTSVDATGKVAYWGLAMGWGLGIEANMLARSFGGGITPKEQVVANKLLFDQPQAMEAMQYLHDLIWKHKVTPTNVDFQYAVGKAAIFMAGSHGLKYWLKGDKFRFGTVEMPSGPAGKVSAFPQDGYAVLRSTKHPVEAMRFLMFLAGPEASRLRATKDEYLQPSRLDQMQAWATENPMASKGMDFKPFIKAFDYAVPAIQFSNERIVRDNLQPVLDKIYARNAIPLKESLLGAARHVNQLLGKYPARTE